MRPATQGRQASALLHVLHQELLASSWNFAWLARRSGVSRCTLHRYARRTTYSELERLEVLLAATGTTVAARSACGRWYPVIEAHPDPVADGRGGSRAGRPSASRSQDPLLRQLQETVQTGNVRAQALHHHTGVPYAVVHRMLHGSSLRVSWQVQALLAAMDVRLFIMPGRQSLPVLARARIIAGTDCRTARRRRQRTRQAVHGRLLIGKGAVASLAREGLSCAEIARGAGVSAERVRQILRALGVRTVGLRRQARIHI
jgi:hypothetical protein